MQARAGRGDGSFDTACLQKTVPILLFPIGTVTPVRNAMEPFFNDQATGSLIVCLLAEVSFEATAFVTHRPEHQLMQTRPGVVTVPSALRACRKPSPFCLSDCLPAVPRYTMPFFYSRIMMPLTGRVTSGPVSFPLIRSFIRRGSVSRCSAPL